LVSLYSSINMMHGSINTTDDIRSMHVVLRDNKGCRNTLRICNNSCFWSATTATRTRIIVTSIRVLNVFFFSVFVSRFRSLCLHARSIFRLSLVLVNTWREQHEEKAITYIYPCTCRDSNKTKKKRPCMP